MFTRESPFTLLFCGCSGWEVMAVSVVFEKEECIAAN